LRRGVYLVDRVISDHCLWTSFKEKITKGNYFREDDTGLIVELEEAKNMMEYDLRLAYSNEKGKTNKIFD